MDKLWNFIMIPFGYIMKFGYDFLGNYGLALFLYALVTKILLFPLSMKQQKSQLGMVRMRPYQDALMKKYGNNKQKYQEELMRLYEREGYSPMSSCLPTLIQLPVIMLIYNIVRRPLSYVVGWNMAKLKEMAQPIVDANPDAFKNIGENLQNIKNFELQLLPYFQESGTVDISTKFLGLDLTHTPNQFKTVGWLILLIPVVAGATSWLVSFVSQKLNSATTDPQAAKSMRTMNIVMPLLSAWMSYTFTAGLGIYWIASNILAIAQTFILHKMYDPKKVLAEVEEKIAKEKEAEKEKRRAAAEKRALSNNKNSKKKRAMNAQLTQPEETDEGVTDTEKEN